jgi:hypothetical protein
MGSARAAGRRVGTRFERSTELLWKVPNGSLLERWRTNSSPIS